MTKSPLYPCPECSVGALRARRVSFFTVIGGQAVSVPDFPAWVCDMCGRREYDEAALAELRAMLQPSRTRRLIPRSGQDRDSTAQPPEGGRGQ
jgi:YgiT-type zinc finger domain-containing protein